MSDGPLTKNLTLGMGSDRIANREPVTPGTPVVHKGIGDPKVGLVRLEGSWIHGDGFVECADPSGASCMITNVAARVSVVFSVASGSTMRVAVNEDGPPLDREWCGADCIEDADLGAAVTVTGQRAYAVTKRPDAEMHELSFVPEAKGLRIHSMTFEA